MTRAEAIEAAKRVLDCCDTAIAHDERRHGTGVVVLRACDVGILHKAFALPANKPNHGQRAEAIEAAALEAKLLLNAGVGCALLEKADDIKVAVSLAKDVVDRLRAAIALPADEASELAELRAENERLRKDVAVARHACDKAGRLFATGDMEGVRLLLCDLNARENASVSYRTELDQLRQRAEQAEALLRECGAAWGMIQKTSNVWVDEQLRETLDKLPKPEYPTS